PKTSDLKVLDTAVFDGISMMNFESRLVESRSLLRRLTNSTRFKGESISMNWKSYSNEDVSADLQLFRSLPGASSFTLKWQAGPIDSHLVDIDDDTLINIVTKFGDVHL
ncbi:hypothetical protein PFISCL1PPCAC_3040, partial [Pristionchus fissidentatus]